MQFAVFAPRSRYVYTLSTRNELDRRGRSGSFERLGCRPWNLRFVCCTWKARKPGENGNFAAAGCFQGRSPWRRNKTKQENQIQRPLLMHHYRHLNDSFRSKEYSIFKSFIKCKNFIDFIPKGRILKDPYILLKVITIFKFHLFLTLRSISLFKNISDKYSKHFY